MQVRAQPSSKSAALTHSAFPGGGNAWLQLPPGNQLSRFDLLPVVIDSRGRQLACPIPVEAPWGPTKIPECISSAVQVLEPVLHSCHLLNSKKLQGALRVRCAGRNTRSSKPR